MESKKKYIIASLIILLAIGFAAVATILKINGTVKIGFDKEGFIADIIFTKSVLDDEDITEESIIENGKQIKFTSHKLTKNGEQTVLDYVVSNKSNQYAGRANVKILEYDEEYIKIENAPMSFDLLPLSNQDGELIITLIKPAVDDKDLEITVEITVEPIQPEDAVTTSSTSTSSTSTSSTTSEEVDDGKPKYTLEIDPDGGEYNGSTDKVKSELKEGSPVTLDEPTKENYIFDYWLKDEEVLEGNTFTLDKNTKVKAVWVPVNEAVAKINETYFTSIQKAFNKAKDNDTVMLLKDTEEIAKNSKIVKFDLQNHTVTGQIINNGTLTVINGKIENTEGSAINNTGTLNLGNNSDEVSTTTPEIIGTDYGIENTGTFNFYDGYVEANLWLSGEYNQIPQNYHVFVDHNESKNCQKTYLVEELDNAVARIEEVYYKNLQDAFISAQEKNKTVYAIRDFEAAYELIVNDAKEVTFDIVGHNVTTGNNITNNGTLTITDSATEEKGLLSPSLTITNNGTLNITNIAITATTNANIVDNKGMLDIKNSTLAALGGYAVNNISGTNITLDDNTSLKATNYAFNNSFNGEVTLSGGNIYGINNSVNSKNDNSNFILDGNIKAYGMYDYNQRISYIPINNKIGKITVKNGNYVTSTNVVISNSDLIIIEDGKFTCESDSNAIISNSSKTIINGGTFESKSVGISNYTSSITINGGNFICDKECINIGSTWSGTLDMYGGTLKSTSEYTVKIMGQSAQFNMYGGKIEGINAVYATGGHQPSIKMYDGEVTGSKTGFYLDWSNLSIYSGTVIGDQYGIYSEKSQNTIKIGDSEELQNANPSIIGELYGLYAKEHGEITFNSGIIKGKTGSYFGEINVVPNGYNVITTDINEQGYYSSYIEEMTSFINNGNKEYNSLQDAIDDANNEDTLTIEKDIVINSLITIEQGKNIVIDINGHQVRLPNRIINKGQLELKDSSENKAGLLIGNTTSVGEFISNNYSSVKLTLNNINIKSVGTSSYLIKGGNVFINNSNLASSGHLLSCTTCEINNSQLESPYIAIYGDTVTITGSTIKNTNTEKYSSELITINKTGNLSDSTIESKYSTALYLYQSTATIKNTNIYTDVNYGITLYKATMTIESGNIISENNYAIYSNSSNSTLTIGIDDEQLSTINPLIKGKQYAIYGSSNINFYFYDGILKGKTSALNVPISKTPDATSIITSEETDAEGNTWETRYLEEQDNIVSYNGTQYNSLKKALNAIETTGTIELITDANVSSDWEIPEGKDIILDIKGYTLTIASDIINNGTLKITNSSTTGSIQNIGTSYYVINYGTLNIENVTMSSSDRSIHVYSGNVSINKSNISSSGEYGIYVDDGNINLNQSSVTGEQTNKYTIYLNGGSIDIVNSNIINNNKKTTSNAALYLTNATGTMTDSSIECKYWYTLYLSGKSTFIQKSGTITANYYGISGGGNFIMDGGEIITSSTAIDSSGTTTINNGKINGYIYNSGTMDINNANITSNNNTAIQNSKTLNIKNATIVGSKQYGINNSGTLTLGENSETENNIVITGETYGIYNVSGTLNFYEGIVKGKTERIYGPISKIADGKMLEYGIENILDSEEQYLTMELTDKHNIIANDQSQYSDISAAIDDLNNGDTLMLLEDVNCVDNITIPENKKIKINLNGHNFNLYGKGVFLNQGTLELMDSSKNENKIKHYVSNSIIKNEGTLTLNNITIETINNSYRIFAINNEGSNLVLEDANIKTAGGGIKNAQNSSLEIKSSTLIAGKESFTYGISNSGNVKINESTIYANNAIYMESDSSSLEMTGCTADSLYLYHSNKVTLSKNTFNRYSQSYSGLSLNNVIDFQSEDNNYNDYYSFSVSVVNNFKSTNDNFSGSLTNNSNGVITFDNPTFTSGITNSGNLTINGGTSTGTIENKGDMTLNNFEITSETSGTSITNNTSVLLTLKNVNLVKHYDSYGEVIGIKVTKGSVLLLDSTVDVSSKGNVYGIYINNGEVTMGIKEDDEVSTEKPYVKAINTNTDTRYTYTGIGVKKVNGKFNFYDGKIVATTEAKPDTTTDVEYLYEAKSHKDEDGNDVCVLEYMEKQE